MEKQNNTNYKNGYVFKWHHDSLNRIIIGHRMSDFNRQLIKLISEKHRLEIWEAKPDLKDRKFSIQINKF